MTARKYFISKEQLQGDYAKTQSLDVLAKEYGVPKISIHYWMKKYNIPRSRHRKFFITQEQIRKDYEELKSCSKLALKYGVSKKLVLTYMAKYGVARNHRKPPPVDILRNMASAGMTTKEVGRVFDVRANYIAQIARKHGFRFIDPCHPGYITRDRGYIMKYAYHHPFKNARNCVMEHRLVCEEMLGRYLTPDEVVHHINRIPSDNRIENLIVMPRIDHKRLHSREKRKKRNDR